MRRVKRLLPIALLLAACAHAPEVPEAPPAAAAPLPPPVPEVSPVDRIRADVEALLAAQGEAAWLAWTTGAPLDVAGPMRGREWIADGGALAALDALPAAANPVEAGRRRMLRDYLVGERLAAAVTEPAPADLTFPFEGRAIALRDTASMLAAEPDAARRAALDAARAPAAARASRDSDARAVALADAALPGRPSRPALDRGRAAARLSRTRSPRWPPPPSTPPARPTAR